MRYTVEVRADGTFWYKEGTEIRHREDGPAVVYADGTKRWYINDGLHREDGPAVEWADGSTMWCVNSKLHRLDGPAVECADGTKYWYINDKRHREDGPAVVGRTGSPMWYLDGVRLSEEDFINQTSPAKELTVAEIEQLLGHRVKVVK